MRNPVDNGNTLLETRWGYENEGQLTRGPAPLSPLEYTRESSEPLGRTGVVAKSHTIVTPEFFPCDYRLRFLIPGEVLHGTLK